VESFDVHRSVETGQAVAEETYIKDKYHSIGFEGNRKQLTGLVTVKNIKKFE
jgi:hypothetical protein